MTKTFIGLLTLPIIYTLHGIVLTKYWSWFVVPHFQVNPIPAVYAIGVASLLSYVTHTSTIDIKKIEVGLPTMIGAAIGRPILALVFGWILSFFA